MRCSTFIWSKNGVILNIDHTVSDEMFSLTSRVYLRPQRDNTQWGLLLDDRSIWVSERLWIIFMWAIMWCSCVFKCVNLPGRERTARAPGQWWNRFHQTWLIKRILNELITTTWVRDMVHINPPPLTHSSKLCFKCIFLIQYFTINVTI